MYGAPPQFPRPPAGPEHEERRPGRGRALLIAGVAVVVLAVAGGVAYAVNNLGGDNENPGGLGQGTPNVTESAGAPTPSENLPADEQCTDEIKANERWVCLTSARIVNNGDAIVIEYEASWADATPNISGGFHLHVYGGDGRKPPASTMGGQSKNPGVWYVEDKAPSIRATSGDNYREAIGDDAKKVCARIAEANHHLVRDTNGGFKTGNCVPIQR
jgi:hypothetical protein